MSLGLPDHLLRPILSAVLYSVRPDTTEETPAELPWTVKPATNKGFSALASSDLAIGTMLIAESPLCVWNQSLTVEAARELFDQLSEEKRAGFLSLCKTAEGGIDDEILNRRAANGFAIRLPSAESEEEEGTVLAFVFEKVSRLNHSCTPNVSQSMNFATLQMEIYTITSIQAGTELTLEYLPSLTTLSRAARQAALFTSFGFSTCYCETCSLPEVEGLASDQRREEIGLIVEQFGNEGREGMMRDLEKISELLEKEKYLALPEFENPFVRNAYAQFAQMKMQRQRRTAMELTEE